jgi:hypothetical protein
MADITDLREIQDKVLCLFYFSYSENDTNSNYYTEILSHFKFAVYSGQLHVVTHLTNNNEAVDILAEVIRYFYDSAPGPIQNLNPIHEWDNLTDHKKLDVIKNFTSAKDTASLENVTGLLSGCAEKAFELVKKSGLY